MISGETLRARPEFYDRNPVHRMFRVGAGLVAPHPDTNRATYQVPAGKLAILQHLFMEVIRDGATGTPGEAQMTLTMQVNGVGVTPLLARVRTILGTVGASDRIIMAGASIFLGGDIIYLDTVDLSTGGTMQYTGFALFFEFDA